MDSFHKCANTPLGYSIEDNYLVSRGLDGSYEKGDQSCKFCPFCGVNLDMETTIKASPRFDTPG